MNLTITDKNLYLLLPGKVSAVAALYADEHHCNVLDAVNLFYSSPVYRDLEKEDTKTWHLGAVALYQMWMTK